MTCDHAVRLLGAYVEDQLEDSERAALEAHLEKCELCRLTGAHLASESMEPGPTEPIARAEDPPCTGGQSAGTDSVLAAGTRLGRYVVLECIGKGGMGCVYAAYDEVLDRRVALKLLRDHAPNQDLQNRTARLMLEAKAMAQLAHPNVVAVHDVGLVEGRVAVSMEYVEGVDLRQWMGQRPRPWPEITQVFLEAGRGLAAAHETRLVHRDFTPGNVLIGADGRVRVTDFGLARLVAPDPAVTPSDVAWESPPIDERAVRALAQPLTVSGGLAGTPPYMAPEQFLGGPVTARSDQFGFCVALYEALYGQRPFDGRTLSERLASVSRGRVAAPSPDRDVPSWLRQVVLRGLSADPAQRFPTMNSLLAALERDPSTHRRRRRIAAVIGAALVVSLVWWGVPRGTPLCQSGQSHIEGAWHLERQRAIQSAFTATGAEFAEASWAGVQRTIDAYARDWQAMYSDACAATHIRGEQSERVLDLRMTCLRRRLEEMTALLQVYERADEGVVRNAVAAAGRLGLISNCGDVQGLSDALASPRDPALGAAVERLRARIVEARALDNVGKPRDALTAAREIMDEAREVPFKPLQAEARQLLGEMQMSVHDYEAARESLLQAVAAAEAIGHDAIKALAWIQLAYVVRLQGDSAAARPPVRLAAAVIERSGSLEDLEVLLLSVDGLLSLDAGDAEGALEKFRRGVELGETLYGPSHLRVAVQIRHLGETYRAIGRYDEALAAHRRATRIMEATYGVKSTFAADGLAGTAAALIELGQTAEALTLLRRQRVVFEQAYGTSSGKLSKTHSLIGRALARRGDFEPALEHQRLAVSIARRAYGEQHWKVGRSLRYLGESLLLRGDNRGALAAFLRAWSIYEPQVQLGDAEPARILSGVGRSYLALRTPSRAVEPLRRSLRWWQAAGSIAPHESARARFAHARALALTNGDLQLALRLAQSAASTFAAGGAATSRDLRQAQAWLRRLVGSRALVLDEGPLVPHLTTRPEENNADQTE